MGFLKISVTFVTPSTGGKVSAQTKIGGKTDKYFFQVSFFISQFNVYNKRDFFLVREEKDEERSLLDFQVFVSPSLITI